jgi:hypothetical protein
MSRLWKKGWKVGALALAIVLIPTAALAVVGTFSSTTATPAVTGTNSSAAAGSPGVLGTNTGGGLNTRYGVQGTANGTAGVGVSGTGAKYGLFSNGPLGVANGKFLTCVALTGCVGSAALVNGSVTAAKLGAGSVGSAALQAGSVGSSALAAGSVGSAALQAGSVGNSALASGSVTRDKIAGGAVSTVKPLVGFVPGVALGGSAKFVGPTTQLTVAAGQVVVVSETAELTTAAGGDIWSDICYDSGGGPVFSGNYLDNVQLPAGARTLVTATETYGLAPGVYTIGLCDIGSGAGSINGDWAQGFAMLITN